MIKFFRGFVLFLFCVSSSVFAADYTYGNEIDGYIFSSAGDACKFMSNRFIAARPGRDLSDTGAWKEGGTWGCYVIDPEGHYQQSGNVGRVGNGCAPPKTFTAIPPNGDESCTAPPDPCKAGQPWMVKVPFGAMPSSNSNGCEAVIKSFKACVATVPKSCWFEMVLTGRPAPPSTPDNGPSAPPPPPDAPRIPSPPLPPGSGGTGGNTGGDPDTGGSGGCPAGTVQAGRSESGTPICVGMGTDPTNPPPPGPTTTKPPVQSPDGNMSTQDTIQHNHDGSITTTTTTKQTDASGNVTVTVTQNTSNTPAGSPGSSDQAQKEKSFCQANPNLSICRESSVSGTCGQTSCTGDAIQCEALRQTAMMQCRQKEDEDAMKGDPNYALGVAIGVGNDPQKGLYDSKVKGEEVDVSQINLDKSGFLGGGSCIAPLVFSVRDRSVSFSFDAICSKITPLRFLVMAMASIIGYLIIARSILGG